jgi:peptidoglycan L-alanyl-D-glutamate endopeptidase CwlK
MKSPTLDPRSEKNIATLLPQAQVAARAFMARIAPQMAACGVTAQIISGFRSYAEQDALYSRGRTTPGHMVTKARGGFSNHNFGIAWDIGLFHLGKYLEESPLYRRCAMIGRDSCGLECGAFWKFTDEPHYQIFTGLSLAEMRRRVASGEPLV